MGTGTPLFHEEIGDNQLLGQMIPLQIVEELDKYVIGQKAAKRAVAIALRNRMRRLKLSPELADEVSPKNILMIGPTGVGKTEIARRMAKLSNSPFVKVEASKFTEVGYVGRDVESMVRDLVEIAVDLVRQEKNHEVQDKAKANAEEHLLDLLAPALENRPAFRVEDLLGDVPSPYRPAEAPGTLEINGLASSSMPDPQATREKLRVKLREGKLNHHIVVVEVRERNFSPIELMTSASVEETDVNIKDMLPGFFDTKTHRRRMPVREALEYLIHEERTKLIDTDQVSRLAVERTEQSGIIFIDEIDKIAAREGGHGPEASREGVQRDVLPLVEGTSVFTKHGTVRTNHILFIAAGAFHASKPSALLPELQGRFPIRVELDPLSREDFVRILKEPKNALLTQYRALLATEGITLEFTDDAVEAVAAFSMAVNERTENIGARRLHAIMEKVLEELSFNAPLLQQKNWVIDAAYVENALEPFSSDDALSQYIL